MNDRVIDLELIKDFLLGNQEAFTTLINKYSEKVYKLAFRIARCESDAEDISQDVFCTLFKKAGSFQGNSAFSSWLYRITANTALMKIRKRKTTQILLSDKDLSEIIDKTGVIYDPNTFQIRDALNCALRHLPGDYRSVFILRDVDLLTNEEAGAVLGISASAVKSRLHRSRLFLRKRLRYLSYCGEEANSPIQPDYTPVPIKLRTPRVHP